VNRNNTGHKMFVNQRKDNRAGGTGKNGKRRATVLHERSPDQVKRLETANETEADEFKKKEDYEGVDLYKNTLRDVPPLNEDQKKVAHHMFGYVVKRVENTFRVVAGQQFDENSKVNGFKRHAAAALGALIAVDEPREKQVRRADRGAGRGSLSGTQPAHLHRESVRSHHCVALPDP